MIIGNANQYFSLFSLRLRFPIELMQADWIWHPLLHIFICHNECWRRTHTAHHNGPNSGTNALHPRNLPRHRCSILRYSNRWRLVLCRVGVARRRHFGRSLNMLRCQDTGQDREGRRLFILCQLVDGHGHHGNHDSSWVQRRRRHSPARFRRQQ